MLNTIDNTIYFAIDFDANNQPTFRHDPSLTFEHADVSDIGNARLNITNFGDFDRIPIVRTLKPNGQKCRWIMISGKWHRLYTANFSLIFSQLWQPSLYDSDENLITEASIDLNTKDYELIESIDNISLLEAFGSRKKVVKIGPNWYVIIVP